MKLARLVGFAVILVGGLAVAFAQTPDASADDDYRQRWVRVTKQAPILEERDRNAEVIRLSRPGEYLEYRSCADLWCRVNVDDRVGYIEARNGEVVDKKGNPFVGVILIAVVLMLGCAGVVVFIIKKKQFA